jgi:DNA-binding SARP family transcriptional activator
VTLRQQRLIAILALKGTQPRALLAGTLWPESSERQATGSLRESIWTVNHQLPGLLESDGQTLSLADTVVIDLDEVRKRVAAAEPGRRARQRVELLQKMRHADLLPGWYEDWVLTEQDRWTRLRLTVLERIAQEFLKNGETAYATDAAQCAVDIDPWRESSIALLLDAHLAEGDYARTLQLYESFADRLRGEFGVAPSDRITSLVTGLLTAGRYGGGRSTGSLPVVS